MQPIHIFIDNIVKLCLQFNLNIVCDSSVQIVWHTSKQKTTSPGQHVRGDGCHTRNYPVPQMVYILHSLWVHEILQSPRRGFLEAKCRPCPFNLVYLFPIEIRVLSVHANPKLALVPVDCFYLEHVRNFGYAEKVQDITQNSRTSRDKRLYGNHHSRRADYDQASEEVDYRLDV